MDRIKMIMRASIVGIIVNALLAGTKMVVGGISGSIAIVLDGVNNFSDAGSSLITIIGAALAGKQPDRKHPFGYGRIEYLSSLAISCLILYAGITSIIESIKKIISPETSDYNTITVVLIVVAVIAKLGLAFYTGHMGKKTNSDALVASGKEGMLDVILSISTVIAAVIYLATGVGIEAYLGVVISSIIIKAGCELLMETVSKLIGEPADVDLAIAIKKKVASYENANGAYDLVLNNYGPDIYTASVHIEVDEKLTATEIDQLTRDIADGVLAEYGVYMNAIGLYSKNHSNAEISQMEKTVRDTVLDIEYVKGMHGFYVDFARKKLHFDIVISLDSNDRKSVYAEAVEAVKKIYPDFDYRVGLDMDLNEI